MPKIKTYSPEEVVQLCAEYMNETHVAFVQKACDFAREAHSGQMRKSGEEYFVHPTQVAAILADLKLDPETIATGFLHDVVEDTEYHFSGYRAGILQNRSHLGGWGHEVGEDRIQVA